MGIREAGWAHDGGPLSMVSFPQGWEQPFWSRALRFPNFYPVLFAPWDLWILPKQLVACWVLFCHCQIKFVSA